MKLSNKTKIEFKKKMKKIDIDKSVIVSYKGHLSYGSCGSLFYKYAKFNK